MSFNRHWSLFIIVCPKVHQLHCLDTTVKPVFACHGFTFAYGESSWEYTIFIMTVNFLSFVFIAVGYIWIFKQSSKSSANVGRAQSNQVNAQAARMQRRIARIIATDFCCWIPICVMAYVRLGVEFSDIVYQISAVLLLPINSAVNPFLFTSLPVKLISWCRRG